jgi:hypothetical protein
MLTTCLVTHIHICRWNTSNALEHHLTVLPKTTEAAATPVPEREIHLPWWCTRELKFNAEEDGRSNQEEGQRDRVFQNLHKPGNCS